MTFTLKPIEVPESVVLGAVLHYAALDQRIAWAHRMNTGAARAVGTDARGRPTRRFIRYGFPGLSDVIGQLVTGHFLAVETKSASGRLTPEQKAFLASVKDAGGLAILARSVADVQEALDAFEPLRGATHSLLMMKASGSQRSEISRLLSRHQPRS